ncbi:MBL fold metallo-hydrolase [Myxococcota bacterium]|nr:MBL fold metallo-hydrolase [Myxococcota bacterium]
MLSRRTALSRWLLLTLLWLVQAAPALAGTLRVEVMDVGQGDAILLTSPAGKRVLIDASIKSARVVDELRARGVEQLDLVVATHPHADHIGGMQDVVEGLPIRVYTDNGLPHTTQTYMELMAAVEARGITYRPARAGQTFKLDDGILIEVLNPSGTPLSGTRSDLNSNSVVLRLTHGERCMLFTGDSEEPTEQALMQGGGIQPCDLLKVAHHGSDHSTTTAWLRAVQPTWALISCGVGNRYGHPGEETMARLEGQGVKVLRTDTMGDLVVESDGKVLKVEAAGKQAAPEAPAMVRSAPARPAATAALIPAAPRAAAGSAASPSGGGAAGTGLVAGDPSCPFVSSRNSDLYHPAGCHVIERIFAANRVCWESEAAAQAAGKTRSQACPATP